MATSTPLWLPSVIYFIGLLVFLAVNLADACGGVLKRDRGVITSPNFPYDYPPNKMCTWDIVTPQGALFTLNFTQFKLEISCARDRVTVLGWISPEEEWQSLGEFCGSRLPPTITFEGKKMRIEFVSDNSIHYGGFSARYSFNEACGGELVQDRGVITSPNFPNVYPNDKQCTWYIVAPRGALFTFNFTDFNTQGQGYPACLNDKVEVYGQVSIREEWKHLGKFCGDLYSLNNLSPNITFEGAKMRIEFVSDKTVQYRGFSARYSFTVTTTTTPPTIETRSPGPATTPPTIATRSPKTTTPLTIETWSLRPTTPPTIGTRSPREVLHDEVGLAKEKLFNWFLGLRRKGTQSKKWGHQLPRIAVALFLANQEIFISGNKTMYEINYELSIQLLSKVMGGGHLKRRDLSLYIPALMVACVDPRNFHGRDLVAELRSDIESNNGTGSPFELLVLCNAGDLMTNRDVQRIATIFDSQHRPFWTDNQAMATLALACVSAQQGVTVDERTLLDMAQELKKRQFMNGTVDNIKTTALVIQALAATQSLESDFDFRAAVRALLAAQREDGSVGSFLDSYYVLPVLSRSNLLNITANHCKRPETSESEALNELQSSRGSRVSMTYSVVIGTDVDLKRTWTLKVPVNSSLYSIMETVQKLDSRQQVEYNVIEGKPFVSSVMGIQDDVETGFYWFTFLRKHNSEDSILVEDSPVDVKIEANQELVLWYKSGQWNKPSSSETLL